ncbi:hypothetical protein ABEB36_001235 [Hypothenemus hampei]|uniref:Peptidoglycan recognition protein family domain-containing protein n=1 Tax=Hypothenemus hampei TaxID=57062 RepID=A0ABD1FEI9_HYPHA
MSREEHLQFSEVVGQSPFDNPSFSNKYIQNEITKVPEAIEQVHEIIKNNSDNTPLRDRALYTEPVKSNVRIHGPVTIGNTYNVRLVTDCSNQNTFDEEDKTSSTSTPKPSAIRQYTPLMSIMLVLLLCIAVFLFIFKDDIFPTKFSTPDPKTDLFISNHPVYLKRNWGGIEVKNPPPNIHLPTELVIISHTASAGYTTFTECAYFIQKLQRSNIHDGSADIIYNFLIGGDGGIYMGVGWDRQNGIRVNSITLGFVGDFNRDEVTTTLEDTGKALLAEGVRLGKFDSGFKLVGENQTSPLRYYSPGRNMIERIRNWDHFYPGIVL